MTVSRRRLVSIGIPLLAVAALVALYFAWPPFGAFVDKAIALVRADDHAALSRWIRGYGAWGPVVIIALMIAQTIVPVLPSILPMTVAVVIYGGWWGGLLAWAGLMVAAVLGYLIGRLLGPVTVDRFIGRETRGRIDAAVERYGIWTIIAARVSPVLSTDAVSITVGLVRMHFLRFLAATAAGILPLVALIAWLGEDFGRLGSGLVWISVVSLTLLAGYIVRDRQRRAAQ